MFERVATNRNPVPSPSNPVSSLPLRVCTGTETEEREEKKEPFELIYRMPRIRGFRIVANLQDKAWIFPALALLTLVIGQVCQERCAVLRGDILGLDLNVMGIFLYSLLLVATVFYKKLYPRDWFMKAIAAVVSAGAGAEMILVKFQVQNNTYCPKCLISGFFFLAMFFVVAPNLKKWVVICWIVAGALFASVTFNGSVVPSYAEDIKYPAFGSERAQVEIIVYSDYLCPACSKADEQINSALRKLKSKARIRFVDVPIHAGSLEYAEVFLYAWFESGDNLESAIKVRETLFEAAKTKTDQLGVIKVLTAKGIPFREDKNKAREIFRAYYNPMMKADKINSTPSLVVIKGNSRKTYVGGAEILKALGEVSAL